MRFEISNWPVLAAILLLATSSLSAATNNLTSLLQQGLFEEEANRNLVAAVANYQALAAQFDKDRQLAATAVFRLGECYRKLGQTNEATASYQRILREFSDETTLVALCRQNLVGLGVPAPVSETTAAASGGEYVVKSGESLSGILTAINSQILEGSTRITMNDLLAVNPGLSPQRLRVGQKIAYPAITAPAPATVVIDDEETEIRRLQAMIQNSPDLKDAPTGEIKITPLCSAVGRGQLRVAEFLLNNGADVEQIGNMRTPLQHAAAAGHKRMVELLLSHGANVNAQDPSGKTPLQLAVEKNFTAVAETLLAAKADVNAGDESATTPLMLAAKNGNRTLATAMLARGADPNLLNKMFKGYNGAPPSQDPAPWGSALHLAVGRRDAAMAALLLTNRADVTLRSVADCTPLDVAASVNATEVAALLIAAGADVNAAGPGGFTTLLRAVSSGHRDMVKLLLEHGANPNATTTDSQRRETPLMWAVPKGAEIATLLLEHKADPNFKNVDGGTALIYAINGNKPDVVRTLLAHGADANLRTATGNPPLIIAATEQRSKEIVTALLEAKADVNATDQNGKTTLHYVAEMGNRELLALLLAAHADVNARSRGGDTPLHFAVSVGVKNQEIVELLLAAKADPNVRDDKGQTPLDRAKGNSPPPGMPLPGFINGIPGGVRMPVPGGGNVGEKPEKSLADLLRQHGALDDLANPDRIEVRRPSANYSEVVFSKGTNDWNRFTLLELLGKCYGFVSTNPIPAGPAMVTTFDFWGQNKLRFPEFGKVTIHRAMEGGQMMHIGKDVGLLLESGDCSGDVGLEWGDWVEIPEADHPVDQQWTGLGTNAITNLFRCVSRTVTLIVKGTTNNLAVSPDWSLADGWDPRTLGRPMQKREGRFMLNAVLRGSGLLRASSDLTRVKVTRPAPALYEPRATYQWHKDGTNLVTLPNPAPGKTPEWTLDCSNDKTPDLWLRNGDVIEVPEK